MRYLFYVLSALTACGAISAVLNMQPVSNARDAGFVAGAFFLPLLFFILGQRASRKAKKRGAAPDSRDWRSAAFA